MPVTADKPAPYTAAKPVLDLIDRHRSRGLPNPVTGEVLGRAGIPESLIPRTIQALVSLDLLDESGKPTETFESIRLAPESEFKKRLEDWLKGAYADIFSFVDPAKDGANRIRDAFRTYIPVGQQSRMVSLFEGLCDAAGLIPKKSPTVHQAATAVGSSSKVNAKPTYLKAKPKKTTSKNYGLPPAIAGLIESLPSPEDGWTAPEREKFLKTFESVLDFSIPITNEKKETAAD